MADATPSIFESLRRALFDSGLPVNTVAAAVDAADAIQEGPLGSYRPVAKAGRITRMLGIKH